MDDKEEKDNSSILTNSINEKNKSIFNPEKSKINQDFLFFKNDILKDIRKLEEKLNIK